MSLMLDISFSQTLPKSEGLKEGFVKGAVSPPYQMLMVYNESIIFAFFFYSTFFRRSFIVFYWLCFN